MVEVKSPDTNTTNCEIRPSVRPSVLRLAGLVGLVLFLGVIMSKLGLFQSSISLGSTTSVPAAFLIGLLAASSSCIAVAGGLLLGVAAKYRERHVNSSSIRRMRPVFLFVMGRVVGYTVLGAAIGALGRALTPGAGATATITIIAALLMVVMGLDQLKLAPSWLRRLVPRMPAAIANRIMDAEGNPHPMAPFLLGAATFFLPCGFTQALQLYALSLGDPLISALLLGAFALGTAPALLGLGYASGAFKKRIGQFVTQFAGALLLVLGFWNLSNGFAIAGYPIALPSIASTNRTIVVSGGAVLTAAGEQLVSIDVSYRGFTPNRFTLERNVPTRFRLSGSATGEGCLSVFIVPKLGIEQVLTPRGVTDITFTPTTSGSYGFSCSMGMYRGTFEVI